MPPKRVKTTQTAPPDAEVSYPTLPSSLPQTPPKAFSSSAPALESPSRRVAAGRITKQQKNALVQNLKLEVAERSRRLRSQYDEQAKQLRQRVEMRINRVPKKMWNMNMGELMAQAEGRAPGTAAAEIEGGAKEFIEDVKRLSSGKVLQPSPKKTAPHPLDPYPLGTPRAKPSTAPSPQRLTSPFKRPLSPIKRPLSPVKRPESPIKRPESPAKRVESPIKRSESPAKHPILSPIKPVPRATRGRRAAPKRALEPSSDSESSAPPPPPKAATKRGTKAAKSKTKAAGGGGSLKRGKAKSNGSLKENQDVEVKVEAQPTTGRRVLRSRK